MRVGSRQGWAEAEGEAGAAAMFTRTPGHHHGRQPLPATRASRPYCPPLWPRGRVGRRWRGRAPTGRPRAAPIGGPGGWRGVGWG